MGKVNLLPMIASRLIGTPLFLDEGKAAIILDVLQGRISSEIFVEKPTISSADLEAPEVVATRFLGTRRTQRGDFSLARRHAGVAVIDIDGSLVNRGAWIGADSGLVSYEGIGAQIDAARGDDEVQAAIIDVNSGGGEATGMFGVAKKLRALAAEKRVVAVVDDYAASAAYGIASAAHEIVISPTSFVGSIGVVMVHTDHSGELAQKGIKATIKQRGKFKTDGHPFGPLDNQANATLDRMLDTLFDQFLVTVGEGRGERLTSEAARATEAAVFVGAEAIDAGIADRVGTFEEVLSELSTKTPRRGKPKETTVTKETGASSEADKTFTQADLDAAKASGHAEGLKASAARIAEITGSDEGKKRPNAAITMATDADMAAVPAAAIIRTLAALPEEGAKAEASTETTAGAKIPTPEERAKAAAESGDEGLGADARAVDTAKGATASWDDAVAEQNKRLSA